MVTQRSYGGVPAEERAAARRERLVEAALDLLEAEGYAAITVSALCRRAKLNERYYYESFSDRSEVLLAALDGIAGSLAISILDAVRAAGDDPRSRAAAAIRVAICEVTDDPRKAALFLESMANPVLHEPRMAIASAFVELLLDQALVAMKADRTPELVTWGKFAATALFAGVIETQAAWLRGQLEVSREQLISFNVEMFMNTARQLPEGLAEAE